MKRTVSILVTTVVLLVLMVVSTVDADPRGKKYLDATDGDRYNVKHLVSYVDVQGTHPVDCTDYYSPDLLSSRFNVGYYWDPYSQWYYYADLYVQAYNGIMPPGIDVLKVYLDGFDFYPGENNHFVQDTLTSHRLRLKRITYEVYDRSNPPVKLMDGEVVSTEESTNKYRDEPGYNLESPVYIEFPDVFHHIPQSMSGGIRITGMKFQWVYLDMYGVNTLGFCLNEFTVVPSHEYDWIFYAKD